MLLQPGKLLKYNWKYKSKLEQQQNRHKLRQPGKLILIQYVLQEQLQKLSILMQPGKYLKDNRRYRKYFQTDNTNINTGI